MYEKAFANIYEENVESNYVVFVSLCEFFAKNSSESLSRVDVSCLKNKSNRGKNVQR